MTDFDERARRASDALRREAEQIADTDQALAQVLGSPVIDVGGIHTNGWSRRRVAGFGVLAVGAAAGLIGLAIVVTDDGEARIVVPATTPTTATTIPTTPTTVTSVPSTPSTTTPTTGATPATSTPTTVATTTPAPPSGPPTQWIPTQPPEPEPPDPATLPHPIVLTVADTHSRFRRESEQPPRSEGAYVQAFSTPDGRGDLYVQTNVSIPSAHESATLIEPIGPWTVYDEQSPGERLILEHGDIQVLLDTNILSDAQLVDVATRLAPRSDSGPGWDVGPMPRGLALVGADYWWTWGGRSDVVVDADEAPVSQLKVTTGVPGGSAFALATVIFDSQSIVDFDGARARYEQAEQVASLDWELAPGVYATMWLTGTWSPDELMNEARTRIETLTADEWAAIPALPTGDGCPPVYDC